MKNLRNEKAVAAALKLQDVIETRKALEKVESELKKYFLAEAGNEAGLIKAGDVVIIITACERASLDRKALEAAYGVDEIKAYDKVTSYLKTEVKAA